MPRVYRFLTAATAFDDLVEAACNHALRLDFSQSLRGACLAVDGLGRLRYVHARLLNFIADQLTQASAEEETGLTKLAA